MKRERDKSPLFLALGLLAVAVGKDIRPMLDEILDVLSSYLPKDLPQKYVLSCQCVCLKSFSSSFDTTAVLDCRKQKTLVVEPSVFTCISLLSRAVGNDMHLKARELINSMFYVPLRYCS